MTAANKRLLISKNRGDSNRYTPCRGKFDQHVTCFPRSVNVWSNTICISHGPHITTFLTVINSDGQSHCSREKGLPTQSTARRLTDPWVHTQFLSQASHWSSGGKVTLYWRQTTRLTGLINTSMWSVRSILARGGQTHRSLTDTGGVYKLGGADLPQITHPPSQPVVSTFHLRASPGLQFNQVPSIKPKCWVLK
jgi:hypothetical protein